MSQSQKINLMPSLTKGMNPNRFNLDNTGYAANIWNLISNSGKLTYLDTSMYVEIEDPSYLGEGFTGVFPQVFHVRYINGSVSVLLCLEDSFWSLVYDESGDLVIASPRNLNSYNSYVGGIFTESDPPITIKGGGLWQCAVFALQDEAYYAIVNGNSTLLVKPYNVQDDGLISVQDFVPGTICQAQGCTWMGGFTAGLSADYLTKVKELFPADVQDYLTLTAPSKTLLFVSSVGSDDLLYMWFPDLITEQSFRLVARRQEQDWIDIPFVGEIVNITPFKSGVLVYGKNGVAYVYREINPKRLVVQYVYDVGIIMRDCVGYCRDRQYFQDSNGALIRIDEKGVKKLGYEFLQTEPTVYHFSYDVESDGFLLYPGYSGVYYLSSDDALSALTTQFPKYLHNFNSCGLRLKSTYTDPNVGSTIPGGSPEKTVIIKTETLIFDTMTTVRGIEVKANIEDDDGLFLDWTVSVTYKVGLGCASHTRTLTGSFLKNGYFPIDISCMEMSIQITADAFDFTNNPVIHTVSVYTELGGKLCL